MKILVVIPTFNERDNIAPIVSQLEQLDQDLDCLFVDDGSPDGTGERIMEESKARPWIRLLQRGGKHGIGSAHRDAISWARENGYQRIVTMDCDLTHSPSDIPQLLSASENADVVVGSRYLQPGSLEGWNWRRKTLTHTAHLLTRILLGLRYDCTGAFRVYRLDRLPEKAFELIRSKDYSFFFESLFVLACNGARISEIPISLPPRTYGSSKMPADEPFRGIRDLISLSADRFLKPERFRVPHHSFIIRDSLNDSEGWNAYWTKSQSRGNRAYQAIATLYRRLIITRRLTLEVRRIFRPGARVLHAGCGSGHVDEFNQDHVRITAVDTSVRALDIYSRCVPHAEKVEHASIFQLPFEDGSFDGIYHLGVIEHFSTDEIHRILCEFRRVLKPEGKMLIFWPHQRATSVAVLHLWHALAGKGAAPLHPPEISLAKNRKWVGTILSNAGFKMESYSFGVEDFWVQAVVTCRPS